MEKIIAIVNQKGGVGKTTTSINLAAALILMRCRVLLIDLDPQGNATGGSGVNKTKTNKTIKDVLLKNSKLNNTKLKVAGGYDLLPANTELIVAEVALLQEDERELRLKKILTEAYNDYDYILIDCPPSLNILTLNALAAANSVLIPVQCEYYALEGLTSLLDTIKQIKKSINPGLEIEGLLRTMFDGRNKLTQDVSMQLKKHFSDLVYTTAIPRNIRLAEAPSHGLPIVKYDAKSIGAKAYLALATELLQKQLVKPEVT